MVISVVVTRRGICIEPFTTLIPSTRTRHTPTLRRSGSRGQHCDKFAPTLGARKMREVVTWPAELSWWVYVVLSCWLLQRWARKMANSRSKHKQHGSLDRLHGRWPSFRRDELEAFAGADIQQQVLSGKHPSLVEIQITTEGGSTRLGCALAGQPSHLPSVSGINPGLCGCVPRGRERPCTIREVLCYGEVLWPTLLRPALQRDSSPTESPALQRIDLSISPPPYWPSAQLTMALSGPLCLPPPPA